MNNISCMNADVQDGVVCIQAQFADAGDQTTPTIVCHLASSMSVARVRS